jgi:hypothetical protein
MFKINEPSEQDVANFISSQRNLPFTYSAVGATNANPPAGYLSITIVFSLARAKPLTSARLML